MSDTTASFGDVLRRLRSEASLSQEELAERAGLSRRGISDLERGARHTPHLETVRLLADALELGERGRVALLAAARPALFRDGASARAASSPSALPAPLTRLIGRETEIRTLRTELRRDEVSLVTLTGPGGVGKTRLAIAVAGGMPDAFPDGVVFVDLSSLTDPAFVLPTIAAALGVQEAAGYPLHERLATFLAPKRLLLVLDNCERVLAAGPDLATVLAASAGVTIFATSRERFHVRAERELPVAPLRLPAADELSQVQELAQIPAITLFVERATAVQPNFALTAANAAATVAICRRLEGLPLAIELAAAWVRVLPPETLLERLEPRLPLLHGGAEDQPVRLRTMRDAIAWSYDLLAEDEARLFRRLAVFSGGFTLEAAEYVGGERGVAALGRWRSAQGGEEDEDILVRAPSPPERSGAPSVLEGVIALVEKSLLRRVPGAEDEPRYQMFETVREFGLEQLTATGEADEARQRHADHFRNIAVNLQHGIRMTEDLTGLAPERGNVLSALAWFDERGDAEALLRLSVLLYGVWFAPGLQREAWQWIDRALNRSSTAASAPRVRALATAGNLALFQWDYARAATYIAEGLALSRTLGDPLLVGGALHMAGLLSYRRGEYGEAEALLDEARRVLGRLGESVPDARRDEGLALLVLGHTALAQEQFERAAKWYQESLACFQLGGFLWGPIDALTGLAAVHYCTGDLAQAAALFVEGLDRARDRSIALLLTSALFGLAGIAAASRQPETGAALLGAADGILASLGAPIRPRDHPVRERALTALTAELGEERLAAACEAGRALSVEQAVVQARPVGETVMQAPP